MHRTDKILLFARFLMVFFLFLFNVGSGVLRYKAEGPKAALLGLCITLPISTLLMWGGYMLLRKVRYYASVKWLSEAVAALDRGDRERARWWADRAGTAPGPGRAGPDPQPRLQALGRAV